MLKSTIETLYSKEGRSISYISRLLEINRKTLSDSIKKWNLPEAEPRRHMSVSTEKFINKNRQLIIARFNADISVNQIATELKVDRKTIQTAVFHDEEIRKAHDEYITRIKNGADTRRDHLTQMSSREYDYPAIEDEQWKPILGYEDYEVSDYGRIRHFAKRYGKYHLVKQYPNKHNGRPYVMLYRNHKKQNLLVARLVAFAFVPGYSEEKSTVNHEDGDVTNSKASNLTWQSQGENNTHAYRELNRNKVNFKRYDFKEILYKNKYRFKTVTAFAKFLGKSETQTRRYIDNPEEHDILLIK